MDKVFYSSKSDEYSTPDDIYKKLDAEFNFTLDPCSTDDNHKTDYYFTKSEDGLLQSWGAESILQSAL